MVANIEDWPELRKGTGPAVKFFTHVKVITYTDTWIYLTPTSNECTL